MTGRCLACNSELTAFESTRRYAESQNYVDLCNHCFKTIPNFPPVVERGDLYHNEEDDSNLNDPLNDWEID